MTAVRRNDLRGAAGWRSGPDALPCITGCRLVVSQLRYGAYSIRCISQLVGCCGLRGLRAHLPNPISALRERHLTGRDLASWTLSIFSVATDS